MVCFAREGHLFRALLSGRVDPPSLLEKGERARRRQTRRAKKASLTPPRRTSWRVYSIVHRTRRWDDGDSGRSPSLSPLSTMQAPFLRRGESDVIN